MNPPRQFVFALIAIAMSMAVMGCARWKSIDRSQDSDQASMLDSVLAHPEDASKRIVLDFEFINIVTDDDALDQSESLWQWVDETAIDASIRQQLIQNGIRVGVVADKHRFRDRIDGYVPEKDIVDAFLSEAAVASDTAHGRKRIPLRIGRRYELPIKQPQVGQHVILLRSGDQVVGRSVDQPQYLLSLRASAMPTPQQFQVYLRPEIQYGESRQQWISSDSAIRIDSRRDTWTLDELEIPVRVTEGSMIVLAPTSPLKGLGKSMFVGQSADQKAQQLYILATVTRIPSIRVSP